MTPVAVPRWWARPLGLARVHGWSMWPAVRPGDRLLVWHGAPPRVGGLVLVELPAGPDGPRPVAVKRVTRREPDGRWWVESDALGEGVDSWTVGALAPESVRARVLLRLPRWRRRRAAGR